jgi:hypothetical protein
MSDYFLASGPRRPILNPPVLQERQIFCLTFTNSRNADSSIKYSDNRGWLFRSILRRRSLGESRVHSCRNLFILHILIAPKLQAGMHLAHPVHGSGCSSVTDFFPCSTSRTSKLYGQAATHQPQPVHLHGVISRSATLLFGERNSPN